MSERFYVYGIFDGHEVVYVGKGCGRRLRQQERRFSLSGKIIEGDLTEDAAFKRERHWIEALKPTANKNPGGAGGRATLKPLTPAEKRIAAEVRRFEREYAAVGPRRYVARFLLKKLNERNAEQFGISLNKLSGIKQVAEGPWA